MYTYYKTLLFLYCMIQYIHVCMYITCKINVHIIFLLKTTQSVLIVVSPFLGLDYYYILFFCYSERVLALFDQVCDDIPEKVQLQDHVLRRKRTKIVSCSCPLPTTRTRSLSHSQNPGSVGSQVELSVPIRAYLLHMDVVV